MSPLRCPFCKSFVNRLHIEGMYVCKACDVCEAHGPRIKVGKDGIIAAVELAAAMKYARWMEVSESLFVKEEEKEEWQKGKLQRLWQKIIHPRQSTCEMSR